MNATDAIAIIIDTYPALDLDPARLRRAAHNLYKLAEVKSIAAAILDSDEDDLSAEAVAANDAIIQRLERL